MPPITSTGAKLALAIVAGSVLTALLKAFVAPWLMLVPGMVFERYAFWQPLSYIFVAASPMGVIFGALIVWSVGSSLEHVLGTKRLLWFSLAVPALAAVGTLAIAIPFTRLSAAAYSGAEVLTSAYWVGWGLYCGQRQTNFWGLPLSGNMFALVGVGFVFLNGAFGSWASVIPEALALAFTAIYFKVGSPAALITRFNSWRLQRELKQRSARLKVVSGDRNTSSGSDRYLH